jgi:hypothetical protein
MAEVYLIPDLIDLHPKITTIREDKADKWEKGRLIHPVINNRSKNRFQFAPILSCISVQKIEIKYTHATFADDQVPRVYIDGKLYFNPNGNEVHWGDMKRLARNDGFEDTGDFFCYFYKDFTGKIIHWTNLKYE